MEQNIHAGHRLRLREKALKSNFENMPEHEVLELLLTYVIPRSDTNPLAHKLINTFGSFANVLNASPQQLKKIDGVGDKTAHFLATIKNFFYVYNTSSLNQVEKINNMQSLLKFASTLLNAKPVEHFYAIYLENNGTVKHYELINSGTTNQTAVNIKKIMEQAILYNACSVAVCHNHPGGRAYPSAEDDKLTKAITMSLSINGVNMIDHVIIGSENKYYSYRQSGLIEKYVKSALDALSDDVVKGKFAMQSKYEFND